MRTGADRPAGRARAGPCSQQRPIWPFGLWLVAFYAAFCVGVAAYGLTSVVAAHWPIALAMVFGSYVAGSTPLGGGSVAFPILVLALGEPATLGRSFAFAIQALGMSSAVLYLATVRRPVAGGILRWAVLGAAVSTPIGVTWLAPRVPELGVKLAFSVVWAAFGVMTLARLRELAAQDGMLALRPSAERGMGLLAGVVGGSIASVIGVGAELVLYSLLVLRLRADPKLAIPTAVALTAFTSVVGLGTSALLAALDPLNVAGRAFPAGLWGHWLAAAPVVVVGAPLGALAVARIPRTFTLALVSVLCVAQLVWTCAQARLAAPAVVAVGGAVLGLVGLFQLLYARGRRSAGVASAAGGLR